ncbi:hypothetical protein EX30DRAFT_209210 [Ascodesmis nigricans]|uniref:Integral membrane protein n=1 Tax=Ascodesmis nigricans TaxID=341454 RepID=A0A4S2MR86_9PEZI|nr:hypothetical protein EX30DRAFT_209210 [Ascodesmis nigricans]
MILTVGLWLIKYSFLFIFLETITTLTKHWRYFLHLTTFLISATLLVAIWSIVKDMTHGLWSLVPTAPLIRAGIGYYGARFIFLDFELELILVIANIVTDICLIAIAYQTVHSFRLPLRAVLFPCALISVGVLVAFGRLALIILTRNAPNYTTFATIPFELFAELETFISVFVACIPGLRVFVRRRQEMGWQRRSTTYQVGAEMGVLAGSGGMSVLESRGEEVPASPRGSGGRLWRTLSVGVEKGREEREGKEGREGKRKERIRSDGAVFLSGEEFLR